MTILSIGSDRNLFAPDTDVRRRVGLQAAKAGEMHVIVFSQKFQNLVEIHDGPLHVYPTNSVNRLMMPIDALRLSRQLPKPDVVTAQDPIWSGHIALHIMRRLRRRAMRSGETSRPKLQLQVHTDILSPAFASASLGNRFRAWWAMFHLRRADSIRVVSNRIKESIQKLGITTPISVLPIFIDAGEIAETPAEELKNEFKQFDKIIVVAARLEKEKNIDDAIRAMQAVLIAYPRTGLIIAGDGSQRSALQKLSHQLGVERNVVFIGRINNIYSLYKGADCMIAATADYEGYGAATVEALTAGCPVVSRDVGVAREAGATIVERDDIAKAVIEILKSGQKGELKLHLPTAEEWAQQWYKGISACCRVGT